MCALIRMIASFLHQVEQCSITYKKLAQEKSCCKLLQVAVTDMHVSCTS